MCAIISVVLYTSYYLIGDSLIFRKGEELFLKPIAPYGDLKLAVDAADGNYRDVVGNLHNANENLAAVRSQNWASELLMIALMLVSHFAFISTVMIGSIKVASSYKT